MCSTENTTVVGPTRKIVSGPEPHQACSMIHVQQDHVRPQDACVSQSSAGKILPASSMHKPVAQSNTTLVSLASCERKFIFEERIACHAVKFDLVAHLTISPSWSGQCGRSKKFQQLHSCGSGQKNSCSVSAFASQPTPIGPKRDREAMEINGGEVTACLAWHNSLTRTLLNACHWVFF